MMHKYKWSVDMGKILLLEDDESLNRGISLKLKKEGYEVLSATGVAEAKEMFRENEVDLIISDISMEDGNGLEFGQSVRKVSDVYLIFLTALDQEVDIVNGYDAGADDYITKPFNPLELVARVKTPLRRYERYNHLLPAGVQSSSAAEPERDSCIDIRGLTIDRDSHKCSLNGSTLSLTPREFSILWYLCENKGRVISSEELFEQVWGEKFLDNNNTVMAHIGRLREKMKDSGRRPKYIKTVWGVGYQIE